MRKNGECKLEENTPNLIEILTLSSSKFVIKDLTETLGHP